MIDKPQKEHYEVDSDSGIMVRTFEYISDLEKYCTSIEKDLLSKIDSINSKNTRITELESLLEEKERQLQFSKEYKTLIINQKDKEIAELKEKLLNKFT